MGDETGSDMRRGELWWAELPQGVGSEQMGRRPVLVLQVDAFNENTRYGNTIIVPLTTKGRPVFTNIEVEPSKENGLTSRSWIKCEHVATISKARFRGRLGTLSDEHLEQVRQAVLRVMGF